MTRTRVDIDDAVLGRVRELYGLRSKRETVDFALRQLLVEQWSLGEAVAMRGSGWDGDLDEMRAGTVPRG